ncbi:MAG: transposase, partial [bacterium]|nr:transposase [bacterium]
MSSMHLSDFDLQQIDARYVKSLSCADKGALILTLTDDLKKARDQLNQNSQNSSRPPGSEQPWQGRTEDSDGPEDEPDLPPVESKEGDEEQTRDNDGEKTGQDAGGEVSPAGDKKGKKKGKPGRRPGMKGYGRKVELPITGEQIHYPTSCSACARELDPAAFVAWTAFYVLDLVLKVNGLAGWELTHIKHIYGRIPCECGHVNRTEPGRCAPEDDWPVALTEWHLVGPTLASLIISLAKRMRSSRVLVQEFLNDWLGVYLCTSTINQCIHEAGRALAPVEDQLVVEVNQADLVHADETSWKEAAQLLWLWVFSTSTVTLFLVGYRTKEIIENLLGSDFAGWLMSDGYKVYRNYLKRLRCWA